MLILAGVSFVKNLRKNPHIEYEEVSKSREWAYRIVLLFLTFFGNIFIAGSGVYYYFANTLILRLSPLRAK